MKKYLSIIILTFITNVINAQESIRVNTFKTTQDYISKTYTETNVKLLIKEVSDKHIWIKKFIDEKTGKKLKKVNTSWAIEYNGNVYFNLGYSLDVNNWKAYLKLDIEGKNYCASFIGKDAPKVIKNSGGNYGGGLQGVLLKGSKKWGKNYPDKTGNTFKILFIDLNKQKNKSMSRNKGSLGNLLKKKELKSIFGIDRTNSELKQMTFEEVIEVIQKANE